MYTTEYLKKLDLATLKQIDFIFKLHSDNSTQTNGYRSLLEIIEEIERLNQSEKDWYR